MTPKKDSARGDGGGTAASGGRPPGTAGTAPGGEGCGGGCLGCAGVLAAVALLWGAVFWPMARYSKWSGFPQSLDSLHPGMTEEEVQEAFPAHCTFSEETGEDSGGHAGGGNPGAIPGRVVRVAPGEADGALAEWGGRFIRGGGGAEMYFDEDGRLVGVREDRAEGSAWEAKWGPPDGGGAP